MLILRGWSQGTDGRAAEGRPQTTGLKWVKKLITILAIAAIVILQAKVVWP